MDHEILSKIRPSDNSSEEIQRSIASVVAEKAVLSRKLQIADSTFKNLLLNGQTPQIKNAKSIRDELELDLMTLDALAEVLPEKLEDAIKAELQHAEITSKRIKAAKAAIDAYNVCIESGEYAKHAKAISAIVQKEKLATAAIAVLGNHDFGTALSLGHLERPLPLYLRGPVKMDTSIVLPSTDPKQEAFTAPPLERHSIYSK